MPPACSGEDPPWPPSLSSGMSSPPGNRNGGWARRSRRSKGTKIARRGIVNGHGAGKGDRPKESARPFSLDGRLSCGSSFLPAPCRFNFARGLAFSRIGSYMGLWEEEHRAPGANWPCSRGWEANSFNAMEFVGEAVRAIGDFRAASCALLEGGRGPVSDGESSSAGAAAARETGGCSGSRVGLHAGS